MSRPTSRAYLAPIVAVILAAASTASAPLPATATSVALAWRAHVGDPAASIATLYVYEGGRGSLRFAAASTPLPSRERITVRVLRGECIDWIAGRTLPQLLTTRAVSTGAGGAMAGTVPVSAAGWKRVRSAWNAGHAVALVLTASRVAWCFPFQALGSIGDPVRTGARQVVTVLRAERWDGGGWPPSRGNAFVTILVRVKALAPTSVAAWALQTPDGANSFSLIGTTGRQPALRDGSLAAGETVEGWLTSSLAASTIDSLSFEYDWNDSSVVRSGAHARAIVPLGPLASQGPDRPVSTPTPTPVPTPTVAPTPGPSPSPSASPPS